MASGSIGTTGGTTGKPHHIPWRAPDRLPPGPKGSPLLGTYRVFRGDPTTFLTDVARRFGDVVYFRVPPQHIFLLNRPDLVEKVLVTDARKFIKSRILQRGKMLLGEGLLTSEGEYHLRQRRLAQPAFHRDRIAGYGAAMVETVERAMSRWRDGERYDIAHEMMRITLAVVGRTLFSADVESEADEIGAALSEVLGLMNWLLLPYSEIILTWPIPPAKRFARAKAKLDAIIYRIIDERRASGRDAGDFLSMLLMAVDENEAMTDRQVRDEALTLFLAGHETTANLLTWTWYLLAQNPEAEARLHEELARALGGRMPDVGDLPALNYTERVLQEALRLYPPAWAIGRMATEEFQADGYTIPPGSIVLVAPYVAHRDPRFFTEPERFAPERWTPELKAQLPRFAYYPFGGGARVCLGERFAWMEAMLVIAAIAQRWRFVIAPETHVGVNAKITLRPKGGLPAAACSRSG